MGWKAFLVALVALLFLHGCQSTRTRPEPPPPPVVETRLVYPDCGTPPQRDRVKLRNPPWYIIDCDDCPVDGFLALDPQGYEDLSYNATMINLGVDQLQNELRFYRRCIAERPKEDENEPVD